MTGLKHFDNKSWKLHIIVMPAIGPMSEKAFSKGCRIKRGKWRLLGRHFEPHMCRIQLWEDISNLTSFSIKMHSVRVYQTYT